MNELRIGYGFDVHAFAAERRLVLGGVFIEHEPGLAGHSDADVLVHAIIDALLGAAALGDIGRMFPDSDERYRNASSIEMLGEVYRLLYSRGGRIVNLDTVVVCQRPRISPHIEKMKQAISVALGGLAPERIGIKGKTTEGLGFTGRGEGIAVHAVALVQVAASGIA
jgi:2-C-methyl-D-erythritol 2,4-cyclodiphosphate synthase